MHIHDCDYSDELNSEKFWKVEKVNLSIKLISNKTYKKKTDQDSLKILNFNYNKSELTTLNEKTKTSKKPFKSY